MNRKNNAFEKISNFITGKGFYLVVLVCVAAIALSGFFLVRSVRGSIGDLEDQPVGGQAAIPSPSPDLSPNPITIPKITPPPASSPSPGSSPAPSLSPAPGPSPAPSLSPAPGSSSSLSPTPTVLVFTWPVNGTVISDFSIEALAYDPTMGDWRTHSGLDIAASVGTEVKATASGTVSAVYDDDLLGTTVVVDHGNDLISVYSNLAAVTTVKEGDKVSTGTAIGAVGKTASAEGGLAPHLHFALFQNDVAENPRDYLPAQ